jgi:predicted lipoprotein with Yx(FWY)xxD motif
MNRMWRLAAVVLAVALGVSGATYAGASGGAGSASAAADRQEARKLVRKLDTEQFGDVLATPSNQALYYWTPERRNPGTIVCTGECAALWPPLYVRRGVAVPRRIAGFDGVFGTIRRPDGRRQLTYNRLPLYTYAHEGPGQVLCNNVDGWFVVRV